MAKRQLETTDADSIVIQLVNKYANLNVNPYAAYYPATKGHEQQSEDDRLPSFRCRPLFRPFVVHTTVQTTPKAIDPVWPP